MRRPVLRFGATIIMLLAGLSACKRGVTSDRQQAHKTEVTISLRPLGINRSEKFKTVRVNSLPKAVLEQMGGFADAGEPFNSTDVIDDPGIPRNSLVIGAVSEHYCALTYWQGGIALTFNTMVFELSDGNVRPMWHSTGQGGFDLEDLKEMIESGRMRNDLSLSKNAGLD